MSRLKVGAAESEPVSSAVAGSFPPVASDRAANRISKNAPPGEANCLRRVGAFDGRVKGSLFMMPFVDHRLIMACSGVWVKIADGLSRYPRSRAERILEQHRQTDLCGGVRRPWE